MTFKETFLLFIKGAIIGISNIIPGVSGGTLAVSLGVYEPLLSAIGNLFKDKKKNFRILIAIILGAILGILSASKLIVYMLNNYQFQTILLFIGLIVGGLSLIVKKVRHHYKALNFIIFGLSFAIVLLFSFLKTSNQIDLNNLSFLKIGQLFFAGALASGAMVIPGISGSFVLMIMGLYENIIATISDLTNFANLGHNLMILLPFGIGVLVGIVLIAKLCSFLFKKYEVKMYYAILGFVLASLVVLFMQINPFTPTFMIIISGIITFLWGFLLARAFDKE